MSESSIYYPSSLREEELKNKVANDWFAAFDSTRIIGNIDFCVDNPATGPFLTAWKDEIQALADELSCNAGLSTNLYRLIEFDLSRYTKLTEGKR